MGWERVGSSRLTPIERTSYFFSFSLRVSSIISSYLSPSSFFARLTPPTSLLPLHPQRGPNRRSSHTSHLPSLSSPPSPLQLSRLYLLSSISSTPHGRSMVLASRSVPREDETSCDLACRRLGRRGRREEVGVVVWSEHPRGEVRRRWRGSVVGRECCLRWVERGGEFISSFFIVASNVN